MLEIRWCPAKGVLEDGQLTARMVGLARCQSRLPLDLEGLPLDQARAQNKVVGAFGRGIVGVVTSTEYSLQRPTVAWPADASLLGYEFAGLLIETLNQGCLISYLGWYVDSLAEGPVWHRWGKSEDEETKLGVSLIVSVYALWVGGLLDVVVQSEGNRISMVSLVPTGNPAPHLPSLETDLLSLLRGRERMRAQDLVQKLPLPSKRRGLGAWFFSGAPSAQKGGHRGWFERTSKFPSDGPDWVQRALDLAKALVALEAGSDVPEDERDRRDEATYLIELEIFDAIRKLP